MLTPIEFGMPPKFVEWRPGQVDAIEEIIRPDRRVVMVCAPTGFGKSIMYMAAAKMSGMRTVVCTSTKGLQDQLVADFATISKDIRGQSNYECIKASEFGIIRINPNYPITVDMGPCHSGAKCAARWNGECEYYRRYSEARRTEIVVTNYALWMYDRFKTGTTEFTGDKTDAIQAGIMMPDEPKLGLGAIREVEMLVLDEAHDAVGELSGFVAEELKYKEVNRNKLEWVGGEDRGAWQEWAGEAVEELEERIKGAQVKAVQGDAKTLKEVGQWKRMLYKVEKVAGMKGEWIIEEDKGSWMAREQGPSVRFDPLWPGPYAESGLFRGVKKVVLVSATVRPKTAELLGLGVEHKEKKRTGLTALVGQSNGSHGAVGDLAAFREFDSTFPLERRPVIHVPTVQMNWRTAQDDWKVMQWIQMIDRIIGDRTDRKGIIHTVSYERAQLLKENSRFSLMMRVHNSSGRAVVVSQFKTSPDPQVLVSPSVDTGYDFPYSECEYQIIAKLPFADSRGKVIKARIKADREYSNYETAQTIVQMTGRGMRAEDDSCETIIVDDNVQWFVGQNREFFPKWWLDSFRSIGRGQLPNPLPKLNR